MILLITLNGVNLYYGTKHVSVHLLKKQPTQVKPRLLKKKHITSVSAFLKTQHTF